MPPAAPVKTRPDKATIAGRALTELKALVASPFGWGVAAVFTLGVSVFGLIGPVLSSQQARLDGVFGLIAGLIVVLAAPLIAARAGLLAAFAFYALLVTATLAVYVAILEYYTHGALELGLLATTYAGLLLVGAAAIAVAHLATTFARRKTVAFVLGLAALVVIWFGGYVAGAVVQDHYQSFSLGIVSLRDFVFFLSLAIAAALTATRLIRSRPWPAGALVLVSLVAVNVFAARATTALDLTRSGVNSLAAPSIAAARRLSSDLHVIGLYRSGAVTARPETEALVGLYASQSSHVIYRAMDYISDTSDVNQYSVKEPNTLVLELNGHTELLSPATQDEQDFTAALLQLEAGRKPLICWSTGVGGRALSDPNQSTGYTGVAALLAADSFTTRDLSIALITSIPSDCDAVALVGATTALPAASVKALQGYIAAGGSLLIAADPWNASAAATASLSDVLKPYGLGFSGSLVVETDTSRAFDPITPAVLGYGASPITRDIQGIATFFPEATAITGGSSSVVIGVTSTGSYAITSPRQNLQRQAGDAPGPFDIMETVQQPGASKPARIVAVGTAGFAENRVFPPTSNDANFELTLAIFQWLTGEDSFLVAPRKAPRALPLTLTQLDQNTIILLTAFLMPGLLLLGGVVAWWRRRTPMAPVRFV